MPRLSPAWALLAALILPPGLSAQPPETFSESLVIREREILVDVPDVLAEDRPSPADFRVLVDGTPREVTRAVPAGGDWTILIYVDQVLARPGTVFYSGLALASRARELTGTGSVEVAVAGSDPRVVLASTREAKSVERTLTDLSAAARVERDRTEGPAGRSGEPSLLQIRRQHDKLLAFLAARRPAGPHAVFLVVDGPSLTPEQTALLERQDPPASMDTRPPSSTARPGFSRPTAGSRFRFPCARRGPDRRSLPRARSRSSGSPPRRRTTRTAYRRSCPAARRRRRRSPSPA